MIDVLIKMNTRMIKMAIMTRVSLLHVPI